jgi:uncharacterized protein YndB with AHSA1/START domain
LSVAIIADRIEQEIHIQAPPEVVFAFFTDAAKHPRWMGRNAVLDPRPGGVYRVEVNEGVRDALCVATLTGTRP